MAEQEASTARVPRLGSYLILCVPLALWIDLGRFHGHHGSDSVVPVLTSLYRWTLFYWECNRAGSLLPLIAMPVGEPFWNLMLQCGLGIFAGLACFFLLSRYLVRDASWPTVAFASLAAFLLLYQAVPRYFFLSGYQPYAVACALVLLGLLLLERGPGRVPVIMRIAFALGLFLLGHWAYSGIGLLMGPLVLCRGLLLECPTARLPGRAKGRAILQSWLRSETAVALALLALATLVLFVVMWFYPYQETQVTILPLDRWPFLWWALLRSAGENFSLLGLLLIPALAALAYQWRASDAAANKLRPAMTLVLAAFAQILLMGCFRWVDMNRGPFLWRYVSLGAFFVLMALVLLASLPLYDALTRMRRKVEAVGFAAVALATVITFGFPSLARVRTDLDRTLGRWTPALLEARATHVCGNYWTVWSSVFHANMTLHERGDDRRVWGVSYRCAPTRDHWDRLPLDQRRVAVPLPDEMPELSEAFRNLVLPSGSVLSEEYPDLAIYGPAAPARQADVRTH